MLARVSPWHVRAPGTLTSGSPTANRLSCAAINRSARGAKAELAPPTCGEIRTPGCRQSGWPAGSGSGSVTSSAARIRPVDSSATRASVSTSLPRATLTSRAPSGRNELPGPDQCVGLRVCERDKEGDLGLGKQPVQFIDRVDLRRPGAATLRDTRDRGDSKPCSRRSIAGPIWPYPMIRTRWSARDRPQMGRQALRSGSGRSSSRCRPLARVRATASSAVLASWTPAALHSVTVGGSSEQELLVPRRKGLHHLELGHLRGSLQDGWPLHVGQDVERDLADGTRKRVSVRPVEVEISPAECAPGAGQPRRSRRKAPRRAAPSSLLTMTGGHYQSHWLTYRRASVVP